MKCNIKKQSNIINLAIYLMLIAGSISPLLASTVSFSSPPSNLNTGDEFSLDLLAQDFAESGTEPLAGGRVDFQFNFDVLSVNQVIVNSNWDFQPDSGQLAASGNVWEKVFFDVFSNTALSGDGIIATVTFTAIGEGQSILSILDTSEFFGNVGATLDPALLATNVNVGAQAIPIPAAFWLFFSSLSVLFAGKPRRII